MCRESGACIFWSGDGRAICEFLCEIQMGTTSYHRDARNGCDIYVRGRHMADVACPDIDDMAISGVRNRIVFVCRSIMGGLNEARVIGFDLRSR